MLKVFSSYDPDTDTTSYYYVNLSNGACTWTKPPIVGRSELPAPMNRWYAMAYEQDGAWYEQYINPYTGKYSHLSVDRAVRMIQVTLTPSIPALPHTHFATRTDPRSARLRFPVCRAACATRCCG